MAFFEAYNPTDRVIAGQAAYNVAPDSAGGYFTKIECFCFTQQVLKPHERVRDAGSVLRRSRDRERRGRASSSRKSPCPTPSTKPNCPRASRPRLPRRTNPINRHQATEAFRGTRDIWRTRRTTTTTSSRPRSGPSSAPSRPSPCCSARCCAFHGYGSWLLLIGVAGGGDHDDLVVVDGGARGQYRRPYAGGARSACATA